MQLTINWVGKHPAIRSIMRLISCLLLLGISNLTARAQTNGEVKGRLIAHQQVPVSYASISLQSAEGKALKGTFSDSLGVFVFTGLANGNYQLHISAMGFKAFHRSLIKLEENIDLGPLLLTEDATLLQGITVQAQKKLIEQTIDKTVLNIENSILAEGNTALELLQKAPGVKVDDDGKISLKGRPGVMVLINGKSTYLSPKELSTLLKGTNSNSIAKIEIMSNPSAKYDAAGNGGIINIQMKKNKAIGLNGTVSVNGGSSRNARYGSGMSLNYRNQNLNVYGSYDYGYRGETEYLDFTRRFYDGGAIVEPASRTSYQDTKTNEPLHTNNFRLGLDLELDSSNVLGMLINGNVGKYTHDSQTGNVFVDAKNAVLSRMLTNNYDRQHWENLTYNLNYQHKFKKEGRLLSADADFASNKFTSKLNLNTTTLAVQPGEKESMTSRRGYVPAVTDVYLLKVDYEEPLGKTLKFESGLKSSFTSADNNLTYDILTNGTWQYDKNGSNHFKYKEQIHAGYINLNKEFKGFSVQAGLRAEYTRTVGHQLTIDSLQARNYLQLFPSIFLNKPLGENHQLQLAYSRRIERPDYSDLNPFRVFRDPLLFYQGNPFLKPELINALQLSHTFKGKYTTSISYNQTKDVMTWVNGQIDELNTTFEMPQNLSKLINYGLSFTASTNFFKWWSGTHFAEVFRNEYSGTTQTSTFNNQTTSFSINSQNSFKAGKGYQMELSAYYYSGSVYGISSYKSNYEVSVGAQKSLFKDRASLKLMINDIFQSNRYREQTVFQQINMYMNKRPDSRRAMLSFSYRFGNLPNEQSKRKTGSEDIQQRIKGGN
jgi:outer membrane receptor protein involved in Fe transport